MIFLKNCFVNVTKDIDIIPITHDVRYAIRDAGAAEGLVTIVVPEPGAAVTAVETLPELMESLKESFKVFPLEGKETKTRRKEPIDISSRVKAAMLGKSVSFPFKDGKPLIGLREEIVVVDFESLVRRREFFVQVMAESSGGGEKGRGMPLGMIGE